MKYLYMKTTHFLQGYCNISSISLLFSIHFSGSNDYVNNYLQPFLADGQQYTYDEFVELLITTLEGQLMVSLISRLLPEFLVYVYNIPHFGEPENFCLLS